MEQPLLFEFLRTASHGYSAAARLEQFTGKHLALDGDEYLRVSRHARRDVDWTDEPVANRLRALLKNLAAHGIRVTVVAPKETVDLESRGASSCGPLSAERHMQDAIMLRAEMHNESMVHPTDQMPPVDGFITNEVGPLLRGAEWTVALRPELMERPDAELPAYHLPTLLCSLSLSRAGLAATYALIRRGIPSARAAQLMRQYGDLRTVQQQSQNNQLAEVEPATAPVGIGGYGSLPGRIARKAACYAHGHPLISTVLSMALNLPLLRQREHEAVSDRGTDKHPVLSLQQALATRATDTAEYWQDAQRILIKHGFVPPALSDVVRLRPCHDWRDACADAEMQHPSVAISVVEAVLASKSFVPRRSNRYPLRDKSVTVLLCDNLYYLVHDLSRLIGGGLYYCDACFQGFENRRDLAFHRPRCGCVDPGSVGRARWARLPEAGVVDDECLAEQGLYS